MNGSGTPVPSVELTTISLMEHVRENEGRLDGVMSRLQAHVDYLCGIQPETSAEAEKVVRSSNGLLDEYSRIAHSMTDMLFNLESLLIRLESMTGGLDATTPR